MSSSKKLLKHRLEGLETWLINLDTNETISDCKQNYNKKLLLTSTYLHWLTTKRLHRFINYLGNPTNP